MLLKILSKLFKSNSNVATITVNGQTYQGDHITVFGNKIIIDGVDRTPEAIRVNIEVKGNIDSLSVDTADKVTIDGYCRGVKTVSGDVLIKGNVQGSVSTVSGDVTAHSISGNVQTVSGDIKR
jgi:hypothetical protein